MQTTKQQLASSETWTTIESLLVQFPGVYRVYIAGPFTKGNTGINVRNAISAGNRLAERGMVPFIPHLTHFWHLVYPNEYEFWMSWCLSWVPKCDAVLRLPGDSNGADREVALAETCGIPVFYDEEELYQHVKGE